MTVAAIAISMLLSKPSAPPLSAAAYGQRLGQVFAELEASTGSMADPGGKSAPADAMAKVVDQLGWIEIEIASMTPPAELVPFNDELGSCMRGLGDRLAPIVRGLRSDPSAVDAIGQNIGSYAEKIKTRLVAVLDDCGYTAGPDLDLKRGIKPNGRMSTTSYAAALEAAGQRMSQRMSAGLDSLDGVFQMFDASKPAERRQMAKTAAALFERARAGCKAMQREIAALRPPKSLVRFNARLGDSAIESLAGFLSESASALKQGRYGDLSNGQARLEKIRLSVEAMLNTELTKAGFDAEEFNEHQTFKRLPLK